MKYLYLLFICFASSISFSQDLLIKEATGFINSNQIFANSPKEKFFLHTNKTTYFSGESINYKAYVVSDDTNLPSKITSNLHLSIYNFDKELIKHQLLYVENGTVYGSIELEKDLKSGRYYILLDTNYSAGLNNSSISEIEIINLLEKKANIADVNEVEDTQIEHEMELKVEFFPESDVLLSRANNTLYYKISLNGLPLETKGELIKSLNEVVVGEFTSNKDGLGSVNFDYYPDRDYFFKITHDYKVYELDVPIAQLEGFIIHLNPRKPKSEEISFTIKVNNDTAQKNDMETILAVIHRNNTCKSVIPFKLDKGVNNYLLSIKEESLFNGVNMITLFNNKNEAISSRCFFYDKNKNIELSFDKVNETKNSITLDLRMLNKYIEANTSVSILPEQNIVNTNSETMFDAFLINPYVSKIKNLEDIDLALQFVSQKNNINEVKKDVPIRDVENGISVTGEVITNLPNLVGYKVLFTSMENGYAITENMYNKNKFSFNNLLLYHPSKFQLALLSPSGKVLDADFKVEDQKSNYPLDSIIDIKHDITIKEVERPRDADNEFNFVFEGEELDEVILFGNKKKNEVVNEYPDQGIIDKPGSLGNGFTRRKTKSEIECVGCTLLQYLDQFSELRAVRGVQVNPNEPDSDIALYFKTRGINTLYGSINVLLLVNGIPSQLSVLEDIMAEDVKDVELNRAGAGYGFRGSNGVVLIELKKPEDYLDSEKSRVTTAKIFSSQTTFGFTKSIDLSKENNLIFNSQKSMEKYSVIDWLPNFKLSPNSSNYIKIKKENYTGLKLIINGFNDEGYMVSQVVNMSF